LTAAAAAARRVASARPRAPRRKGAAGARRPSEAATLALAVSLAVALGVACGIWINSELTSAASAGTGAQPRTTPEARAPEAAAETRTADRGDASAPAAEIKTPDAPGETAEAAAAGKDAARAAEQGRVLNRAAVGAAAAARDAGPREKVDARPAAVPSVVKSATPGRAQGGAALCGLYASAGSLAVRGGGAAPLVVGGPGENGRVTVTTPDWSNIAVLQEGRTGNGWVRYSVRSVSGRPGVYAVRFATPCGSKTIPVTVTGGKQ
jgi:hypothetical protein